MALASLAMLSVAGVILAALAFVVLQNLDSHRDELAERVGEMLGQPVTIGAAQVIWQGATPILRLENFTIGDQAAGALGFNAAELRINSLESLRRRTLATSEVRVYGASLAVARDGDQLVMLGVGGEDEDSVGGLEALRTLLAGRAELTLANATLLFHPAPEARPVRLAMDVGIRRAGDAYSLSGALRLPGRSQSYITAEGTFAIPEETIWQARLRVRSAGLLVRDLGTVLADMRLPGADALARFDVNLDLSSSGTMGLDGRLALASLDWSTGGGDTGPRAVSANARLHVDASGWRAELRDLDVAGSQGQWQAPRASLAYRFGTEEARASYSATLSNGRIEDLMAVAVFLNPRDEVLLALSQPGATGSVVDATVAWVDEQREQIPFDVSAKVEDLGWPAQGNRVGVAGLSGAVWLKHTGGQLTVDTTAGLVLNAPSVMERPLPFDAAQGTVDIEIAPPNLTFSSSEVTLAGPVVPVRLAGEVVRDGRDDLLVDVAVESAGFEIADIQALLPSPRLSDDVNEWLTGALGGGRVSNVSMRLLGRDSAIRAEPGSESLRVSLDFEGVGLDYEPGWPALAGMDGSLTLEEGKLVIETGELTIGGVGGAMQAVIENISAEDPELAVDATLEGAGREMLALLASTPAVNEEAARRLQATPLGGNLSVRARVREHLESGKEDIRATVRLDGNRITGVAGMPALDDIRGTLQMVNGVLSTEDLDVTVASEPTRLAGEVDLNAAPRGRVDLRTRVPHQFWVDLVRDLTGAEREPPAWLANLSGRSAWMLSLELDAEAPPRVALGSDLRGIAIDLPPPLGKAADAERTLSLSRTIGGDPTLRVTYGDVLSGLYRPDDADPDDFDLALRVGPGEPPPLSDDRWVVRGRLDAFDTATLELDVGEEPRLDLRRLDLDLVVDKVSLGGADFDKVGLRVVPSTGEDAAPSVQLDSERIAGVLVIPADPAEPIGVNLDRLDIPEFERSEDVPDVDPRSLPAMSFSVKSVTYGGRDLGAAKFVALKTPTGIAIDKIYIIAEDFDAQGVASWSYENDRHVTRLRATLNANHLGALFKEVGYSDSVASGGATQMVLDAGWWVPPLAASLANMTGDLEFQAGKGRFEEVSTGAGAQLIGLLNLRILPRLLTLDLGSLFKKGLEFNNIYGRFRIEDGQAYTNDLTLDSPTARVTVAGRTGIVSQDYDQVATIVPDLSGSLPAAGAAFGVVGAGVGAALWLVEQVTDSKVVDQVASFQYSLTGSWEDPVLERINIAPPEEEENDDR